MELPLYLGADVRLGVCHVGVVDVEHVVTDHLLAHPAGPLCHLQQELIQVRADGRAPEAPLPQQLILDARPLLCHVLQGVLLPLRVSWRGEDGSWGHCEDFILKCFRQRWI